MTLADLSIATWLIIAGAVLGLGAIVLAKKKGTRKTLGFIGLGLLGVGLLGTFTMVIPQLQEPFAFTVTPPEEGEVPPIPPVEKGVIPCPTEDVTVTLSSIGKYTAISTEGTHRYRVNGAPAKTVSNDGTFEASYGDILDILWMNESKTGYFSAVDTFTVPCGGTKTFYTELAKNASLTVNIFNEEGNLEDGVGENETLGTGDVVTLDMNVKGEFEKDFTHGFTLIVEMNKTAMDDIIIADEDGVELADVDVPAVYTTDFGSDAKAKAYAFPAVISNIKWEGTITIDTDDNTNPQPAINRTTLGSNIILTFSANNYYIDDDNKGVYAGPAAEDEDETATRADYEKIVHVD